MVNKILHLYWGRNKPLSYLRYLTVISFRKHNPDWDIKIWVSDKEPVTKVPWKTGENSAEYTGYDYLQDLWIHKHAINFESIGIPANTPEVHKSDLLRWYLLGTQGGVWSDFDILYIKPLTDKIMKEWKGPCLCAYTIPVVRKAHFHAIGFLASEGELGREFFIGLFKLGVSKLPQESYQAVGANMLEGEYLPRWNKDFSWIDHELVYPYHSGHDIKLYFTAAQLECSKAIGLHWYAGNPASANKEVTITHNNIQECALKYAICREALK